MSNNINAVLLHGKVGGILKEFLIVNPVNLVLNEAEVPSEMMGPDGKSPLMTARTLLNFPNRMQLILEETPQEVLEMLRGEKEQDKGTLG